MAAPQRMTSTMTSSSQRTGLMSASSNRMGLSTQINTRLVTYKLGLGCGIVLGLIGASLLVAFGILYVKPFMHVKDMVETECITENYTLSDLVTCNCDDDDDSSCESKFPCLLVYVNFSQADGGGGVSNASLYDDHETYVFHHSSTQCSYHPCGRSAQDNYAAVRRFAKAYSEPYTSYPCFYHPSDPSYALLDVVRTSVIVHAMLWPGLALLIGVLILAIYVCECGVRHSSGTPVGGHSPFNSLEKPWLRHIERNYEKVGTLSEYHGDMDEHNDAHSEIAE